MSKYNQEMKMDKSYLQLQEYPKLVEDKIAMDMVKKLIDLKYTPPQVMRAMYLVLSEKS